MSGLSRYTLMCTVILSAVLCSNAASAGQIDDLARHLCLGEKIEWEGVLQQDILKYVSVIEEAFKTFDDIGRCESYRISKDRITLRYDAADIVVKAPETDGGLASVDFEFPKFRNDSFEKISGTLEKLPGRVSVTVKGGDGKMVFAHNPDEPLATGSSFKLFILKALLDDIAAGRRSWSDVVTLDDGCKSAGSGIIRQWPDGSPMTLKTLATLMISISDNTATDVLIDLVGRERLETMMPHTRPLISTRDLFALKLGISDSLLNKYLKADLEEKRVILRKIADFDLDKLRPGPPTPVKIGEIEWFASSMELADAVLSMRGNDILAISPGVITDRKRWKYIGYKGGAEPGVIQYTQLLQSKSGRWYAISASWNDSEKPVNDDAFAIVVHRLAGLLR